ncbi:MAG TPA: c-type cytochrome [Chromatiales bacterium]|nr:c-type cytochrome [Chromatiales bacterium]
MIFRALSSLSLVVSLAAGVLGTAHAAPDGALLYARNCAACHGADGRGGVGVPLALPDFLATASDEYLRKTIRLGRPGRVMPAFPHLSDAEVDAIVRHIRSFAPDVRPRRLPEGPVRGDPKRGAGLYARHCAACHGPDGEGGKGTGVTFSRPRDLPIVAPALNNPGFLAAASDAQIKATLMWGRKGTPMPSFLEQGLSERDIDDIVAFVRSFERRPRERRAALKDEPPVLVRESASDYAATVENVKQAVVGQNFRLIRVQPLEQGFFPEGEASRAETIVYFCNFNFLYKALAVDPRVGLFLPCRVTVVERGGKVLVMTINPKRLAALFNNEELDELCERMRELYEAILEDSTL